MSTIGASGKAQARWYSPEEKAQAVRMVFALRKETGASRGTVRRVADQLGYGVESVQRRSPSVEQPICSATTRIAAHCES
jgi:transposase